MNILIAFTFEAVMSQKRSGLYRWYSWTSYKLKHIPATSANCCGNWKGFSFYFTKRKRWNVFCDILHRGELTRGYHHRVLIFFQEFPMVSFAPRRQRSELPRFYLDEEERFLRGRKFSWKTNEFHLTFTKAIDGRVAPPYFLSIYI